MLVWIHGGGYGYGDGTQDMSEIINANDQGFVAVTIQYRVRPASSLVVIAFYGLVHERTPSRSGSPN